MDIRSLKNVNEEKFPAVIWDWCSKPTAEEIDFALQKFSDLCISAVYLRPSEGLVQKYLSEDYFELVRTAIRRSARYGLKLYIFDESGKCSGCGGEEIISVPDYRMKDILKAKTIEKGDIVIDENEKTVLRDMSSVRGSGRNAVSDISDDFVAQCFEETVYDAYLKNCRRFMGYEISGFVSTVNLPDAPVFSKEAMRLSGEEKSVCSAVLSNAPEAQSLKNTYFENMSRLVSEGFTRRIKNKCEAMNVKHAACVCGNKKISRQLAYIQADTPFVLVDGENADIVEIKLAASVCAQFGKSSVFALKEPSYSKCFNIQNGAYMCAAFGADSICFDSVAMSLTDRRKYENSNMILSVHAQKDISAQISRLCTISQSTCDEAELLLVYPQASVNCDEKDTYEKFSLLAEKLAGWGVNFHIAEECALSEYGKSDGEGICMGNIKYKTLLFPDAPHFSKNAADFAAAVSDVWAIGRSAEFLNTEEKTLEDVKERFAFKKMDIKGKCYINRRTDERCEYVFITALEDVTISGGENIFVFAPENGEIYALPTVGEFLLRKGKTATLIISEDISYDEAPPLAGGLEIRKSEKICDALFAITESDENIYVLRTVSALFGKKAYRETPIDDLHKAFYSLKDGESVSAKYAFYAEKGIGRVFAHFENAQFYDVLEINGKPIENLKVSQRDLRFFTAEITDMIATGKNTIHVEFKKYNNYNPDFTSRAPAYYGVYNLTSFEPVYLSGDFDCKGNTLTVCGEYGENVSDGPMPDYYGALKYGMRLPDGELRDCLLAVDGEFDVCRIKIGKREFVYTDSPLMELFNIDSSALCEVTIYNTAKNLFASHEGIREPFGIKNMEIRKFIQ